MRRASEPERGRWRKLIATVIAVTVVLTGCTTPGRAADGATAPEDEQTGADEFEIIAQGQNSAVRLPVQTVVTERETWIDGWAALTANESPAPERPEVSFADSTVVIVILGERPTAGYSVGVSRVLYSGNEATVEVSVEQPDPDAMVAQVLTTPFVIVRLEGPELDITFIGDDVFEEFRL